MSVKARRVALMDAVVDVDMRKCICSGMCTTIAPGVFKLDDDGKLVVLRRNLVGEEIAMVKDAIACCPVEAISLLKESE
jgi:ferredoxin